MEGLYPGYETGQTSGKPSVFALKTVINCFLNVPERPKSKDPYKAFEILVP